MTNPAQEQPVSPERRAADAMPLRFEGAALKKAAPIHAAFADAEVETIDIGAVVPPGHDDHADHDEAPAAAAPRFSPEQNRERLQIVKFKHSFDGFEPRELTQVTYRDIRRGDFIEIKTPAGKLYFRVVDRIKGASADVGEILIECRYDIPEQWTLAHAASVTLPVCTKAHKIVLPDGSERSASRSLKMTTDTSLPEQVKVLLHENFFLGMTVYATPEREKLRLIDIGRWLKRVLYTLKNLVDENNRKEREKERQRQERKRQKKAAKNG